MNKQTLEEIRLKLIKKQRDAYDIVKFLRSTINTPIVSYLISTHIITRSNGFEVICDIKQLPDIRIHHGASDQEDEFLKLIDIDNTE